MLLLHLSSDCYWSGLSIPFDSSTRKRKWIQWKMTIHSFLLLSLFSYLLLYKLHTYLCWLYRWKWMAGFFWYSFWYFIWRAWVHVRYFENFQPKKSCSNCQSVLTSKGDFSFSVIFLFSLLFSSFPSALLCLTVWKKKRRILASGLEKKKKKRERKKIPIWWHFTPLHWLFWLATDYAEWRAWLRVYWGCGNAVHFCVLDDTQVTKRREKKESHFKLIRKGTDARHQSERSDSPLPFFFKHV